ncbi:MAG TPA: aminopeptidase [Candidatus Lachnoclostridium stercoravium]|uniref:Aminopeptidase n=1 Tax=Candidatus Lachnoclostridium stercoravium TaxID=2838633 RepID=A0A9D2HI00_9FIRM|nr:aminopeptidase [Candidatus Lachnoclostridium stercoravium]
MDYRSILKEENENAAERFALSLERIREIPKEQEVPDKFREYFSRTAGFIEMIGRLWRDLGENREEEMTLEELKERNHALYEDVLPENYEESYGNPSFAVKMLGDGYGQLLSFLYAEIRGEIVCAYEGRLSMIAALNETFLEVYGLFAMAEREGAIPQEKEVKDILYWFVSDYCDQTVAYRIRECLDPSLSFAKDIIMGSDLSDLRYLYRFGEYISQTELKTAEFLSRLPQETIDQMADTYVEGFRKGFEVTGRSLEGKKTAVIRYELGFERMIKRAVEDLEKLGLEPILYRAASDAANKNMNRKIGYYSQGPNRQYDYDHRQDCAVYMDKAFKDRKLGVLKVAYEQYKELASCYAGPLVVETFGQEDFEPVNKKEALSLTDKQEKLAAAFAGESAVISQEYVRGDETSFTIIAFPIPQIGPDFEEIFQETIRINTLDYEEYKKYQQAIIDVLDQAEKLEIKGRGKNQTDLQVSLHLLKSPEKETNFENCVADVNIPVGEVFTSPVLKGTEGVLNVESVYIDGICFKNLKMSFKDGMVTDYSCDNFPSAEEGKKLVKQMILKNHDTLPMGECAIGTNTTAYAMAERFGIIEKLPILIVEKMGPHFAVGDTCYSWAEDTAVYNPDGKEIIARDNEISILRKEDVSRAYFSCHTDITIPYRELEEISAILPGGSKIPVIRDGRFAVPGAEALNLPLEIS